MTIALVAAPTVTEQGTGGSSTFTVNYPATTVAGEILILSVGTGNTTFTISGWTSFASTGTSTNALNGRWKQASGSEGGTTFNITVLAGRATAAIARYSGVDNTTPIDVTATTATTTGTPLTIGAFTTVTDNCMLISAFNENAATSLTYTQPSGFTQEARNTNGSGSGVGKSLCFADGVFITTAGTSSTRAWTVSGTTGLDKRGYLAALRPAAASTFVNGSFMTFF